MSASIEARARELLHAGNGDRTIARQLGQTRDWVRRLKLQMAQEGGTSSAVVAFDRSSRAGWAQHITAAFKGIFTSAFETGKRLADAKSALPYGEFVAMVEHDLPFTPRTAQMFMAISADDRLSETNLGSHLPHSWRTLYELTRLSNEELADKVSDGTINPKMKRQDLAPKRERDPEPQIIDVTPEREPKPVDAVIRSAEARALPAPLPNGNRCIMASRQEPSDSLDYFPTPPYATRALIERVFRHLGVSLLNSAWEPCCGEGHMAEVLAEYFRDVTASDVHDYGYGHTWDFLDAGLEPTDDDWIIFNPPFGDLTEAFVLRALEYARIGVAAFVRLQWLETIGRYERLFRDSPPTLIAFFCERVNLCKGRWEPDGSTATAYIWLVWIKGAKPRAPFWIPPGCRADLSRPDDVERFTARPVIRKLKQLETPESPSSISEPSSEAPPQAEASLAGTVSEMPAGCEGREQGRGANAPTTQQGEDIPEFLRVENRGGKA